jgi:hypothetical protein
MQTHTPRHGFLQRHRLPTRDDPPRTLHENEPTMATIIHQTFDKAWPRIRRALPFNPTFDRLFHRLNFYRKHRRMPNGKMLFNDVLYRLKTSNEILDPLRVFVSDKEHVKQFVREKLGDEYNVPIQQITTEARQKRHIACDPRW